MAGEEGARPGRARSRRADAARNAELLLTAAKELFAEHGPGVALDEVARRAGVGNATLYRHFPTRGDLLAAVYAEEVEELCRSGDVLLHDRPPGEALFAWLDGFVAHIATKHDLAQAVTDGRHVRRSEVFERWHASITSTAEHLLVRAQAAGTVRPGLTVADLIALASGVAMTGGGAERAGHLLGILRHGIEAHPSEAD